MNQAKISFLGNLNDFLSPENRNQIIEYNFKESPSIKDVIESLGPPHTEVEAIVSDGIKVSFAHKLKNNENIEVFPAGEFIKANTSNILRENLLEFRFIVDANVGKLAKYMRMLGFDTFYDLNIHDPEIAKISEQENRIVLTRDLGLLKRKNVTYGYFLRETQISAQVAEVVKRYSLIDKINAFSRCLECNGYVIAVEKALIKEKLDPGVFNDYNEFFNCMDCNKIYWKGFHYETMLNSIKKLQD